MRSLGYLSQTEDSGQELDFFNTQYVLAKQDIKKRLHILFKRKYANTPNEWRTRASKLYQEYLQRQDFATGSNAILPRGFNGGDYFLEDLAGRGTDQILFFNDGVPTASTYANTALNGDVLIDTNQGGYLYINRGTSAVPSWVRWSYKDLTDNLLNGTTALRESASAGTLYYMARYLSIPQNSGSFSDRENIVELKRDLLGEFNMEFAKEYELLEVDASGDGLMSNTELDDMDEPDNWVVA